MSRYLVDRVPHTPNIEVIVQHQVQKLLGDGDLGAIRVAHKASGKGRTLPIAALFIFMGTDAPTGWLAAMLLLDEKGFSQTGPFVKGARSGSECRLIPICLKQTSRASSPPPTCGARPSAAASAVGEGWMAARLCHMYLAEARDV